MARPVRQFVFDQPLVTGVHHVDGDEARHMTGSFRLGPGDPIRLVDGSGMVGLGEIQAVESDRVRVLIRDVVDERCETADLDLTVIVSPPKDRRMDNLVEKCAELGVARIVPTAFRRSVVRPRPGRHAKAGRWERTAREAAKQCGRPTFMEIEPFVKFQNVIDRRADMKLLLDPDADEGVIDILEETDPSSGIVLVGPEGGLEPAEVRQARAAGFRPARLTRYTLRIETAVVAAAAILLSRCRPKGQ